MAQNTTEGEQGALREKVTVSWVGVRVGLGLMR